MPDTPDQNHAANAMTRRDVHKTLIGGAAMLAGAAMTSGASASPAPARDHHPRPFTISLAQWSLHKSLFGGELDNLDFARVTRMTYGLDAVEYVNAFFKDKATDDTYLATMNRRASDAGVRNLLIMVDGEGNLGDPDRTEREKAVRNHHRWVAAARELGCHSIRVNAASSGSYDEQIKLAADGLRQLTEYAAQYRMNVIVENHGGLSSNGAWLAAVMREVGHLRCGTLPDFGNFRIQGDEWYDRYTGVAELMPYAKAVSAKSHDFDADGNETRTDYDRMVGIVLKAGYDGYIGIEYEGGGLNEKDGILATKRLLERVREKYSQS